MPSRKFSRRDLLKSAGVGVVGLGVGAAIYERMNRYIIGTKSNDAVSAISTMSESSPLTIDLTDHTSLQLVSGTFSDARLETLLSRRDVDFAQPDRYLDMPPVDVEETPEDQTVPWGIDRIGAPAVHESGESGSGIEVGVIDSGINNTHPDLEENIADPSDEENHNAWSSCGGGDCEYPWTDDSGHGTHVSGTIAAEESSEGVLGVAPDATLHALKVCNSSGRCRTSAIAEAIRHSADQGWDVVNLSLGSPRSAPALEAAGEYALEAGVLPIAAAGNRGRSDSIGYPAAYDEFVAVTATTENDSLAGFSSRGPEADIAAPGAEVYSADLDGYSTQSGTSMAAPHVTGAAAHVINNTESVDEARQQLLSSAEDIGLDDNEQGAGLVDVAAALEVPR